ncbi:MAG: OmpA family protein [Potamolinea sp.]
MTDSFIDNLPSNSSDNQATPTAEDMAELRSLLLGLEPKEVDQLYERLENPNIQPDDLSKMLPEAIMLSSRQNKLLTEAIVPTVEEAIESSVKKDLNVIADAIFPVMGPAIRKAIATALDATLESFNQTLEHSVSPQSFKWRLEALQTGKSFVEVVLLRTLLFQVEQVFLIHQETGLLLHHLVKNGAYVEDVDLVSAMLTAIQSFVQDSFKVQTNDSLETLQIGELTIWIEKGSQAVLAAVIRGHPPKELKLVFRDAIEKIHFRFSRELKYFNGDASPFEASKPYLEDCLQNQYKKPKQKKSYTLVYVVGTAILIALGTWAFFSIRDKQRWATYLEKLYAEPGIVVTKEEERYGKFFVFGLRDPLAKDPKAMLKNANIPSEAVISRWKPFVSLDSGFVADRAKKLLKPPATVSLKVKENGILYATGTAPGQWILETRKVVQFIPGVTKFEEDKLVAAELSKLELSKKQIEKQVLFFETGKAIIKNGQKETLQNLVKEINKLTDYAELLNKDVRLQILGHTQKIIGEKDNLLLSQARASAILSILSSQGIKTTNLTARGVGSSQPLSQGFTEQAQQLNRSVTFKIILTELPKRGATQP